MISVFGNVDKIIFKNDENGYTVARITTEEEEEIVVVGYTSFFVENSSYEFMGDFTYHNKYGEHFKFEEYKENLPQSEKGIINYLSSSMIPHVGKKMAKRIVEEFKEDTLDVIENNPEKLLTINGIGRKKYRDIKEALDKQYAMRKVFLYFSKYNISSNTIIKIYREYGDESIETVQKNPYELVGRIRGMGFKSCDEIAKSMGLDEDSEYRKIAGLKYVLLMAARDGHSYLPIEKLITKTEKLLGVKFESKEDVAKTLTFEENFFVEKIGEDFNCYFTRYLKAENYVAGKLNKLNISFDEDIDIDKKINEIEEFRKIKLSNTQRTAVKESIEKGVFIITGGPGTGKTTTLKVIIDVFESLDKKIKLAAPTGRAAKRMKEQTGRDAFTIHKLLEISVGDGFEYSNVEELECDVLIVDEMSMVDILLIETLLMAIDNPTRLILVGDKDQLPSVGAGNVLSDILKSKVFKYVSLEEIFRQNEESMIVKNAHLINHGDLPVLNRGDFFMIHENGEMKGLETIKDLITTRLPNYFNLSIEDIQILTPMKKGTLGTINLNKVLQEHLNKSEEYIEVLGTKFKLGDRVMQIKNNYELEGKIENDFYSDVSKGVFNGDMGYITNIDKDNKELEVTFDGVRKVKYDRDSIEELNLSYAMTIHKSQGSEFPIVIIPIYFAPPILMTRNLIYTAITRASKVVVLVGIYDYLKMMIDNNKIRKRYSKLADKLVKAKDEKI